MNRLKILTVLTFGSLILFSSCLKNSTPSDPYYTPTTANVTPTATLAELQKGRDLFLGRCGSCHSLYSPDNYSPTDWKGIVSIMGPRAGLSPADMTLVTKYLSRGK